jgi:hypothetical protein
MTKPALFQDFEPAVIGAADRNAVIAGRGLNPDIVEAGLAGDPAVRDAVQGDAAGNGQVLGPGGFASHLARGRAARFRCRPAPPGQILPVPHRRARSQLLPSWM